MGNLINNPGWETGNADAWSLEKGAFDNTCAVAAAAARTGSYGLSMASDSVVSPDPYAMWTSLISKSFIGKTLEFSVHYRCTNNNSGGNHNTLGIVFYDGTQSVFGSGVSIQPAASSSWTLLKFAFILRNIITDIRTRVYLQSSLGRLAVYIDDMSLQAVQAGKRDLVLSRSALLPRRTLSSSRSLDP